MNTDLLEPICQQIAWKNDEIKAFAVSLISAAIHLSPIERVEFSTDIVDDESRGTGTGIAGSVVELLKNANIIEPVGVTVGDKWYPERAKSTRSGRKSAYVCLYRLKSLNVAQAFLRRNQG